MSSGPTDLHFGGQSICHAATGMTLFMKVVPDRYYGTRAIRSHFVAGMRICWRGKGQGGNLGLCRWTHSAASKAIPSARWTTRSERRNIIALLPLWKKSWPRLCPPTEAGPFSVAVSCVGGGRKVAHPWATPSPAPPRKCSQRASFFEPSLLGRKWTVCSPSNPY